MLRGGRYIKDVVYFANDGIVSTFAIVAGVEGASLNELTIIVLGAANLLAAGFSIAASSYLSSTSERDFIKKEYKSEQREREMKDDPEEEKVEMVELLREQGYEENDAQLLSRLMFKNKHFFVDLMMHEELEISPHPDNHIGKEALIAFSSFVAAGLLPLLPFFFFFDAQNIFLYSSIATAAALFIVGALRALVTKKSMLFSGAEMLFVGGVAAAIAYGVGAGLKNIASF